MRAYLSANLMSAARMETTFLFNLVDPAGGFTMSTHLGSLHGKYLNPLAMPLALIEIKSRQIDKMVSNLAINVYG